MVGADDTPVDVAVSAYVLPLLVCVITVVTTTGAREVLSGARVVVDSSVTASVLAGDVGVPPLVISDVGVVTADGVVVGVVAVVLGVVELGVDVGVVSLDVVEVGCA